MPVTKEQIEQYVKELGLGAEQEAAMIVTLSGNERAATQFVGGRLRQDDYTRKTTELAEHKKNIEANAANQVTAYAQELQKAQDRINKIVKDFSDKDISLAKATSLLNAVKTKFNLSDEDVPALEVTPAGNPKHVPPAEQQLDVAGMLKDFKKDLMKEINRELLANPQVNAIQYDIMAQHQELTGKRMERKEMMELLALSTEKGIPLEQAWERKYGVGELRMTKRDEANKTKWQQEWEAEQTRKRSEEALAGIRPGAADPSSLMSPVLAKQFQTHKDDGTLEIPKAPERAANQPELRGADKAAATFMKRRAEGVPMGAPVQVQKSA